MASALCDDVWLGKHEKRHAEAANLFVCADAAVGLLADMMPSAATPLRPMRTLRLSFTSQETDVVHDGHQCLFRPFVARPCALVKMLPLDFAQIWEIALHSHPGHGRRGSGGDHGDFDVLLAGLLELEDQREGLPGAERLL